MTRRKTTDEERELFRTAFAESRPIKAIPVGATKRKTVSAEPSGIDGATAERMRRGTLDPDARSICMAIPKTRRIARCCCSCARRRCAGTGWCWW